MSGSTVPWQAAEIRNLFARHEVRYLFVGWIAASLHGFPEPPATIDLLVDGDAGPRRLANALRELGLLPSPEQQELLARGAGCVPVTVGPYDLRLHFTSPGIPRFSTAWWRRVELDGFPVCHLEDVVAHVAQSDQAADREILPRLHWFHQQRARGEAL